MNKAPEKLGDRYEIEARFAGGFSTVCKAKDLVEGRVVAIKTPVENVMANPKSLRKFVEEARRLCQLDNANVIKSFHFYDQGELDSRCHLVMEWMDQTLDDVLDSGKLGRTESLEITRKILKGLRYIHETGLIHRDIKPQNIFLSADGTAVKLGDFGIAGDIGAGFTTQEGSFQYVAPELRDPDAKPDERIDIYALGLLVYELLCGREKFRQVFAEIYSEDSERLRQMRWLHWHINDDLKLPPLATLDVGIDENISRIVERMTAKSPDDRYHDVKEIMGAFGGVLGGDWGVEHLEPIVIDEDKGSSKKGVILALGVAVVGLVLAAYFFSAPAELTDADVIEMVTSTKAAREAAVLAGAEAQQIAALAQGDQLLEQAGEAYDIAVLKESIRLLNGATERFLTAEREAYTNSFSQERARAQDLLNIAESLRVIDGEPSLISGSRALQDALSRFDAEDFRSALEMVTAAQTDFQQAIRIGPRRFQKGSTNEEIADALRLCGEYSAECQDDWYSTEVLSEVAVEPFQIDANEVTIGDFARFVSATGYQTQAEQRGFSYAWNGSELVKLAGASWRTGVDIDNLPGKGAVMPVTHIALVDAKNYCDWAGGRLPSEAEWEYAARGPSRLIFPWGNTWNDSNLLWVEGADVPENFPVASFDQVGGGLPAFDYAGSVWEWVLPEGRDEGVLKGGSYLEKNPANFRAAAHREYSPDVTSSDDGMRCVRDAEQWPDDAIPQLTPPD